MKRTFYALEFERFRPDEDGQISMFKSKKDRDFWVMLNSFKWGFDREALTKDEARHIFVLQARRGK